MAEPFQTDRLKQESGSLSKEWLDWLRCNADAANAERNESGKENSAPALGS